MEIQVRIERVLDVQTFTSKKDGSVFVKHQFVGSTEADKYPKTICFSCMGDEAWAKLGIEVGRSYSLSIDLSSREWEGRWYTEVSVWKAVAIGGQSPTSVASPQPSSQQAQYAQPQPQGGSDGLPF